MINFKIKNVAVSAIASAIPVNTVDNCAITDLTIPNDSVYTQTISKVKSRRIAKSEQTASDLGYEAANKIIVEKSIDVGEIGVLIFISRTPDYRSPATAAVLQNRLGLKRDCIAYDVNVGELGFIYGLNMVSAILGNSNLKYGLVVFGDTPSKQFKEDDDLRMLFSDAASAILLEKRSSAAEINIAIGTKSEKIKTIFNSGGGFRYQLQDSEDNLALQWLELQEETKKNTAKLLYEFIEQNKLELSDVDLFSFNNFFSIQSDFWSEEFKISSEKQLELFDYGLTGSSTTPMRIENSINKNNICNNRILDFSFGEGLAYGIVDFHIDQSSILELTETDDHYESGSVNHEM